MRFLIFGGSGKIGRAAAWDLAQDPDAREVALVGRNLDALGQVRSWIGGKKVTLHAGDADNRDALLRLMDGYDAGVLALPDRRASYKFAEYAIAAGLPAVDVLEEYHRRPDAYEVEGLEVPPGLSLADYGEHLHSEARRQGVTFLDGLGLAPGLTNVALGEALRSLDEVESAVARVGGIPTKEAAARHPLRYMITWAFEHVLREYMIRVGVIKGGEIVEVEAGSDRESFRFRRFGRDEELECAVTPGMPSFLYTRPGLTDFAEKTIRWPGHWQAVATLKECGLLGLDPVTLDGQEVVPRRFLSALLTPRLQPLPGETDVCVLYTTAVGIQDGRRVAVEHYLWDEADTERGHSAMMRTTAFPAAIGARMLARREIAIPGIVAPEDAITGPLYARFVAELAQRGIRLEEATLLLDSATGAGG
jgi:saccharopine dehydrogenase-like NADP-dependent oxidoreductase